MLTAFFFLKPNLKKMYEKRDVEGLIKALKHKDDDVREGAARFLREIVVKAENGYDRMQAVRALGERGEARSVELFIQALKDEDYRVRWSAAEALGKIGDTRAVEPLFQATKDRDEYVRKYASEALRKMGVISRYFFVLGWPWEALSEERRLQRETFEQLRKNKGRAPFSMEVCHVDFVPQEGLSRGLSMPKIVMVWDESQMPRINAMGGVWGDSSVIRKWVSESTGGTVYQDADVVGPRPHGLEGLPAFKGIIDSFKAP